VPSNRALARASRSTETPSIDSEIRQAPNAVADRAERVLVIVTIASLALIAVAFAPGMEMFRLAKEAVMRTQAIVSAFVLAVAVAYGGAARLRELLRERAVVIVGAGAVLWTVVTTLTSGNRALSVESLVTVVCSAVLFVAVWYVSHDVPVTALLVLVPVIIVNALLVALQEYEVWNPFEFSIGSGRLDMVHLTATGLIGNPNDVGGYFALCAVVLLVTGETLRGRNRWTAALGAAVAVAGVFVSQTRTAVLTLVATAIFIAFRRSWKAAATVGVLVIVALLAATQVKIPALTRITRIPENVAQGRWEIVLSERLPAFVTAIEMFRNHPIVGVGPGAYKYFYLDYRIRSNDVYPESVLRGAGANFAETHNDHLQLLAETGLPGYALFVAACVILALRARRRENRDEERARFAAALALPLVITVAVLALAFFPLQIAVTRHLIVTMSALIIGWSRT
jgi:O-antigen ligase